MKREIEWASPTRAAVWYTADCGYLHLSYDGTMRASCPDGVGATDKATEARAAAIAEVRARVEGAPLYVGADAGATMRLSEIDRMRDYRRRVLAILDDVEAGR